MEAGPAGLSKILSAKSAKDRQKLSSNVNGLRCKIERFSTGSDSLRSPLRGCLPDKSVSLCSALDTAELGSE